jgi:hypothetical protein
MFNLRKRVLSYLGFLLLILVGTTTQHAEAQRSGRSVLRMGHLTALQLLVLEDVQKELKLTNDHAAKVRRDAHSKLDGSSSQTLTKKLAELHREADTLLRRSNGGLPI